MAKPPNEVHVCWCPRCDFRSPMEIGTLSSQGPTHCQECGTPLRLASYALKSAVETDPSLPDSIPGMRPIHPGEILREEYGMKPEEAARDPQIAEILAERAPVDWPAAIKLAHRFGTTTAFWMNLQRTYEAQTKT